MNDVLRTIDLDQERTKYSSLELLPVAALLCYFFRDAMGGFFRYYTQIYHVSALWFIPDVLSFACIPYFLYRAVWLNRIGSAAVLFVFVVFYIILGGVFLGDTNAALSSIKMIVPIFVGFSFFDRSIGNYPKLLLMLEGLLYISIVGVIASAYIRMPWIGFSFESFGTVRTAGRLWWSANEERLSGFAADNTMASLFIMLTFVITSFRRSYLWCLALGAVSLYAVKLTTGKTALGALGLYLICLTICRSLPYVRRFSFVRRVALISFLAPFIPLICVVLLTGIDLNNISTTLFSLQDRINNSWQLPFVYLSELFPAGIVLGCGVGCFNYPQLEFSQYSSYWVPEDNFYLGTYTMFGVPFVYFVAKVFEAMRTEQDVYKLVLIFVMNVFTITVLTYGPATGLIVISICFSSVFRVGAKRYVPIAVKPDRRQGVTRPNVKPTTPGYSLG